MNGKSDAICSRKIFWISEMFTWKNLITGFCFEDPVQPSHGKLVYNKSLSLIHSDLHKFYYCFGLVLTLSSTSYVLMSYSADLSAIFTV